MKTTNQNKASILIVDDEKALRLLLGEFLKKHYHVVSLADGQNCLQWLESNPAPAAIILDLMMPTIDGMDVIKTLRSNPDFNSIAIIVLSSKESSTDRIAALKAGADDFLIKPFNPEELMVRIQLRIKTKTEINLQLS
jgi:DNA-binding response OmpR family regulator